MENNELVNVTVKQSITSYLDKIKKRDQRGFDYWHARDLQNPLGYADWRNFKNAIDKAKMTCSSIGEDISHHFGDINRIMAYEYGDKDDIVLTRLACYLIAMNGDSSKEEIAIAQTYFAVQTRKQELAEQQDEGEARLALRNRVKDHNRYLSSAAKRAGVQNFAIFHNVGWQGLYNGLGVAEIKEKKGISPKEDLLDRIGRTELAINDFRITQTESKLELEQIQGEHAAREAHKQVGLEVRKAIQKIGGTPPEDLPSAPSIKKLEMAKKPKKLRPPKP